MNAQVTEYSLDKYRAEEAVIAEHAKLFVVGERVKADQLPKYTEFRSLYPITRNGDLIAFLGIRNGWKQQWRLYNLRLAPDHAQLNINGVQPDQYFFCYRKETATADLARALLRPFESKKFQTRSQLLIARVGAKQWELDQANVYLEQMHGEQKQADLQLQALRFFNPAVLSDSELAAYDSLLVRLRAERDSRASRILRQVATIQQYEAELAKLQEAV